MRQRHNQSDLLYSHAHQKIAETNGNQHRKLPIIVEVRILYVARNNCLDSYALLSLHQAASRWYFVVLVIVMVQEILCKLFYVHVTVHRNKFLCNKTNWRAVQLQAWSGPEGSRKLRFPDFMTTAQDGGKVSLTHRPTLPPGNTPGTHFCQRLNRPKVHSATGRKYVTEKFQ